MIPLLKRRASIILLSILVFEMVIVTDNNTLYGLTQQKTEKEGKIYFVLEWGSRDSDEDKLESPHSIAIDSFGNLFVTDTATDRIQKFTSNGTFLMQWGTFGNKTGEFSSHAHGVAIDSKNNVYVTDRFNHNIQKFTSNGTFLMQWGTFGNKTGEFLLPLGIDIDSLNNLYIVDQAKSQIQKFTSNGTFLMQFGNKTAFKQLEDIEIDSFDNIYVTDKGDSSIKKYEIA